MARVRLWAFSLAISSHGTLSSECRNVSLSKVDGAHLLFRDCVAIPTPFRDFCNRYTRTWWSLPVYRSETSQSNPFFVSLGSTKVMSTMEDLPSLGKVVFVSELTISSTQISQMPPVVSYRTGWSLCCSTLLLMH